MGENISIIHDLREGRERERERRRELVSCVCAKFKTHVHACFTGLPVRPATRPVTQKKQHEQERGFQVVERGRRRR